MATKRYGAIKDFVKRQIGAGRWPPGTLIPSESDLCGRFGVSRMTVIRALRELTSEGLVYREQGRGTFVAELSAASSFLRIRDIREEIVERGHEHRALLRHAGEERAAPDIAALLEVRSGSP